MLSLERMGARIRKLRDQRGWSQANLAARSSISREYLARMETGRQDPRISVMVRLAKVLRVTVDELVK
jgi:putative transcriptional regulator